MNLSPWEMFCLHSNVAKSNNAHWDKIITGGNRQRIATAALQGLPSSDIDWSKTDMQGICVNAVQYVELLLKELDRVK